MVVPPTRWTETPLSRLTTAKPSSSVVSSRDQLDQVGCGSDLDERSVEVKKQRRTAP